jgi:conjugal transfer pilus assembly protein TraE
MMAFGLLAVNIVLSVTVAGTDTTEKTIVVPPTLEKPFWVKGSEMSPEYLEEMSRYLTGLVLNVTPKSVDGNVDVFLRYVAPEAFGDIRTTMAVQGERLKRDNVSTAFYPVDYQTKVKQRQTVITGDFTTMVGKQVVSTVRRSWRFSYSLAGGRLWVSEFLEVESEHPFEAADDTVTAPSGQ